MSIRDTLIPIVDDLREDVVDVLAGLRRHTTVVRTRVWTSGRPDGGAHTDTDVQLTPRPKVMDPSPKMTYGPGGMIKEGDRIVSKISATYTMADLIGTPGTAGTEVYWLIDGDEYIAIGEPQEVYLGWEVQVRRRRRQTATP